MKQPIIIIGAGVGGLATAIRLRVAGHDVIVLEKNLQVGGKMYEIRDGGFRWDTGPSVITMKHVFEDLFTTAGRRLEDYIDFMPIDPMTRYFFTDGTIIDATSNLTEMAQQIEAIEPKDVEGYLRYLSYAAQIHRITGDVFIYDKPPTPASFRRVPVQDWMKADPLRTMQGAIESHVKSPYMRQLLGRFATYVGGSPYEAPATLNVIAHVELTGGVWYPRGGIYMIAENLAKLAKELGIVIYTDCGVEKIQVDNGQAVGVLTDDGKILKAKAIVSNLDVTSTYDRLLDASVTNQRRVTRLKNYEPSCSGFVMLLGVEGDSSELVHHNIFFSDDYKREFKQIFKENVPADNPTIYVSITSKVESGHAPDGFENWFILVNAPATTDAVNWEQIKQDYRDMVLQKLADRGLDIHERIVAEHIITPEDLGVMSGGWRGALYGPSANKKFTAFLRPHNRAKDVKNLYFTGGTTHPGGGVPMVTLSGKVVADMIGDDGV